MPTPCRTSTGSCQVSHELVAVGVLCSSSPGLKAIVQQRNVAVLTRKQRRIWLCHSSLMPHAHNYQGKAPFLSLRRRAGYSDLAGVRIIRTQSACAELLVRAPSLAPSRSSAYVAFIQPYVVSQETLRAVDAGSLQCWQHRHWLYAPNSFCTARQLTLMQSARKCRATRDAQQSWNKRALAGFVARWHVVSLY
jgi:hypothetical protein